MKLKLYLEATFTLLNLIWSIFLPGKFFLKILNVSWLQLFQSNSLNEEKRFLHKKTWETVLNLTKHVL